MSKSSMVSLRDRTLTCCLGNQTLSLKIWFLFIFILHNRHQQQHLGSVYHICRTIGLLLYNLFVTNGTQETNR